MPTDLLLPAANERIDLVDFEFLCDSGFQENIRQPNEQFFTDPDSAQRSWILDGFTIANPSGDQVEVTKGRAILGQREGALVYYGALTVEGDATKIIDMASLTPDAGYGLYLRFEYVDGDSSSRIFWNPAGTGSETAQTVATRRNANWSIRIELTNPGAEWLKIATLDNTGVGVAITDERPMYFEGTVDSTYESGWSSDGGGGANDRNADRQQYGVKDFQTFTAAMRQCLEDIKGRGLRRWWERDIGGLNVGFDAAPVEDRVAVGSADFNLFWDSGPGDSYLYWNQTGNDYFWWDDGSTTFKFYLNNNERFRQTAAGTWARGIGVSDTLAITPVSNAVVVGHDDFRLAWDGTDPYVYFDANDYIWYDRSLVTNGAWIAVINSVDRMQLSGLGMSVDGLAVSASLAVAPAADSVRIGSADFNLFWDSAQGDSYLYWNQTGNDYFWWDDSTTTLRLYLNNNERFKQTAAGTWVRGLGVSDTLAVTPASNTVAVGTADFRMYWDGTDEYYHFDADTYLKHTVSSSIVSLYVNAGERFRAGTAGARVAGLAASTSLAVAPAADRVRVGDVNFEMYWDGTDPYLYVDSADYLWFDRSTPLLQFVMDGAGTNARMQIDLTGTRFQGLAVSSDLSLAAGNNALIVGNANYTISWDGTDPYIYFDAADYLTFTRATPSLGITIDGAGTNDRFLLELLGTRVQGLAVSDDLTVAAANDTISCGTSTFKMYYDGTDQYFYWDADTYYWHDVSGNLVTLRINDNLVWQTHNQTGTRVAGLAVSDGLSVAPTQDKIRIGDADFDIYFDGTDPYINFDLSNTEYLHYDRTANRLRFVLGVNLCHYWQDDLAFILGTTGDADVELTAAGQYTYLQTTGMMCFRAPTNSGDVNVYEAKVMSTLLYDTYSASETVTSTGNEMVKVVQRADASGQKIYKLTAFGQAYRDATVSDLTLNIGLSDDDSTWLVATQLTWDPGTDTSDTAADQWLLEFILYIPTTGATAAPSVSGHWIVSNANQAAVTQHTLGNRIGGTLDVDSSPLYIRLYGTTGSGTKTVKIKGFFIEELGGKNN